MDEGLKMELTNNVNQGEGTSPTIRPRGRKKVLTPSRIAIICEAIVKGATERAARLLGGVCAAVFYATKKNDPAFRKAIEEARQKWANVRHLQHRNALEASRWLRAGRRKPKRPEPIVQAKLIAFHLIHRVPLTLASISPKEEQEACIEWNLPFDAWQRQKEAFKLMQKIYKKRAELRGQNPQVMQAEESQPIRRVFRNQTDYNPTYGES